MIHWQWLVIAAALGAGCGAAIGFATAVSFTARRRHVDRHRRRD